MARKATIPGKTRDQLVKECGQKFLPSQRNGLLVTDLNTEELNIALCSGVFPRRDQIAKYRQSGTKQPEPKQPIHQPEPGQTQEGEPMGSRNGGGADAALQLAALIQQVAGQSVNRDQVAEMVADAMNGIREEMREEMQALASATLEVGDMETLLNERLEQNMLAVQTLVSEALQSVGIQRVRIEIPELAIDRETGVQHPIFPLLLSICARSMTGRLGDPIHIPVFLVGPAGSSKTTAARMVAEALELPYHELSITEETGEHHVTGYLDVSHNYVPTPFRLAYEFGGVFCADEMDKGRPGVMAAFNAGLSNESMTFPDGKHIRRHANFIAIATANTYGLGANRTYVGSNRLDGATLDRFFFLEWGYSERLESGICGIGYTGGEKPLDNTPSGLNAEDWVSLVHQHRNAVLNPARGGEPLEHVISPRASIYGIHLLDLPLSYLKEGLIWKGASPMIRAQVEREVGQ